MKLTLKKGVLMALSIYLTITILVLQFAYHVQKPLSFLQNAVIFMVVAIITRQCLTLLVMEWKFYKMTEDDWLFVCLLLCRDVLTPMMSVIFINFYVRAKSAGQKAVVFLVSLVILLALHQLAITFNLLTYLKWNFFYTILLNAGFLLTALGVFKLISLTLENRKHESL
ncbi:hypothetical protein [Mesobacillus subterraneus]|uniref:Uncharacterized protein n=1 Tax=Mesobacillus subterraneus TaxID=285983 RepID=A0A3R9DQT3_9BACI|nr:hypothetical protein [Mesobacillus subterraneus]RSD25161.1 hypothetical protein EJA10_18005 [Mesobacillus subterraneus]